MAFPDEFVFPEHLPMTADALQVGNAVPPLLACRVGEALAAHLRAQKDLLIAA
jgi:site-specific DNA-cytosine methylase